MVNIKGLWHCRPAPAVREWVTLYEEAVKRGLIKQEGGNVTIAEHTHEDLERNIQTLETNVQGLAARLAGASGTVYNDLRARLAALEDVVEDVRATVQKIKDL